MPGGVRRDSEELPTLEQTLTKSETLFDHLQWQLNITSMVDDDKSIALEIIGALDESGFLPGERPLEDIAIRLHVSVDHVERVLLAVQTLDPVGVCCAVPRRVPADPDPPLWHQEPPGRAHDLRVHARPREAQLRRHRQEGRGEHRRSRRRHEGDPGPGPSPRAPNFGGDKSIYITPDLYVHKIGDEYAIVANEDGMPMLRVSRYCKAALSNGMNGEAKSYVQEKLRSAQWLIRSIHQRQRTIYRVMESILKFQRDFFDRGIDHLSR